MASTALLQWSASLGWLLGLLVRPVFTGQIQQVLDQDNELTYPRLNFSSPSPLVFHSAFGLLQQWPNTFFPNGHTIAPCTIAKNTNLYHARGDSEFPPSPEWFAFDAEMSYAIAGFGDNSHLLTFRTTKDVKCLYFDGTSASLMDDGSMDAQMLLIHNNSAHVPDHPAFTPPPTNDSDGRPLCPPGSRYSNNCIRWNPLQAEYDRARGLCDFIEQRKLGGWGWGYEGVVRMNAGFELIWCNFSSPSARLISWLNVSAPTIDAEGDDWLQTSSTSAAEVNIDSLEDYPPGKPPRKGAPGNWRRPRWSPFNHPFFNQSMYEWFHIAANRYGFSGGHPGRGEARISVDSCGLFSFYEPALVHQEGARVQQERSRYNISAQGHWNGPSEGEDRAQALNELTRRRGTQRVMNVSVSDGLYMRAAVEGRLAEALDSGSSVCSGIDWLLSAQELVASYADRLRALSAALLHVANDTQTDGRSFRDSVAHIRMISHSAWMPFYEYPRFTTAGIEETFDPNAPHSRDALSRCQDQYLPLADEILSSSEQVINFAVSEVTSSICGTLLPVFLETEQLWLAHFNNASAKPPGRSSPVYHRAVKQTGQHLRALGELMAWLGWADQWTDCSPGCGPGQVCYIPMWPALGIGRGPSSGNRTEGGYPHRGGWDVDSWEQLLWEPRCVTPDHFPLF